MMIRRARSQDAAAVASVLEKAFVEYRKLIPSVKLVLLLGGRAKSLRIAAGFVYGLAWRIGIRISAIIEHGVSIRRSRVSPTEPSEVFSTGTTPKSGRPPGRHNRHRRTGRQNRPRTPAIEWNPPAWHARAGLSLESRL